MLVGGSATPLKNMSSSLGMISNPIFLGKKIDGNQTTNQHIIALFIQIGQNCSSSKAESTRRPRAPLRKARPRDGHDTTVTAVMNCAWLCHYV